jgi:ABC-type antimicrobial peptide transport system permease subunit
VKLGDPGSENPWYTVVGVVGDVRQRSLDVAPEPELMLPYRQDDGPYGPRDMLVRTTGASPGLADAIRRELRGLDPAVPIGIRTMEDVAASGLGDRRAPTFVISGFAVLTLVLSILGVYAMVAFAVADRAHELGIRLAIGARSGALVGMILKENLGLASVACLAGLLIAAAVARNLERFLWGVGPIDPESFLVAALAVLFGALAASYLPARRVTRIEPAAVLRNE